MSANHMFLYGNVKN